jgi:hypothetical protein
MLTLPSGQILWSNGHTQLYLYNPDGAPDPSWQPTISGVTDNGDGTFLLTGTQLNGISEGGGYGDDAEMSSNYPIVQLSDGNGNVFYARTFYWSNTGVATGNAPVSTYFTLPAGISPGDYSLTVVANGIASNPVDFVIGGGAPAPGGGSGHSLPAFSILPTVAGRATSAHPAPVAVVAEGDAELLSAAKSQPVTRAAAIFGAEENGTVDFSESGENTLVGDLASSGAVTFMSQDDHTESSFVTLSGRIDNEADLFPDALVDAFYAADPFSRQF